MATMTKDDAINVVLEALFDDIKSLGDYKSEAKARQFVNAVNLLSNSTALETFPTKDGAWGLRDVRAA